VETWNPRLIQFRCHTKLPDRLTVALVELLATQLRIHLGVGIYSLHELRPTHVNIKIRPVKELAVLIELDVLTVTAPRLANLGGQLLQRHLKTLK